MRDTSARIHATQQAILKEEASREEQERRLLKGRLSRAKRGIRRLLTFAKSRPIQRLVKMNERLGRQGQILSFHELSWNVIGLHPTSYVAFSVDSRGIRITLTNTCWVTMTVSAIFPYKKGLEVAVHTKFGNRNGTCESPMGDILERMATGHMTSLYEISEEGQAAIRVLASWSRPAPFEKIATSFLEELESKMAGEFQKRK
ncbi:MAG: hypothetical protein AAB555_02630 [Patescibacteria group bacterium]